MEQPQYNMLVRDKVEVEFDKLFRDYGYGTTIWSPLASGILTGKYNNGIPEGSRLTMNDLTWLKEKLLTEENIDKVIKVQTIAKDLNTSLANLAIAWCLKNNHVSTVITGATKLSQLQENLKSIDVVEKLNDSVMESIESVLNNAPKKPQY